MHGWISTVVLSSVMLTLPGVAVEISAGASPRRLEMTRGERERTALRTQAGQRESAVWRSCIGRAVNEISKYGPGGYSTSDKAHDALGQAFEWNERLQMPHFRAASARPSFCSGAVYAALLSALAYWDAGNTPRRIRPKAWQALLPHRVADGVGAWGHANANGPGLAVLVHRLGAGVNFTDWSKARPGDLLKLWWTDQIGGSERGHLVIFVKDLGDEVRTWSSHQAGQEYPGGFGFKTFRKSDVAHVLFTHITNPAAFNKAPLLGANEWLNSLLHRSVSWEECLRRSGVKP